MHMAFADTINQYALSNGIFITLFYKIKHDKYNPMVKHWDRCYFYDLFWNSRVS